LSYYTKPLLVEYPGVAHYLLFYDYYYYYYYYHSLLLLLLLLLLPPTSDFNNISLIKCCRIL